MSGAPRRVCRALNEITRSRFKNGMVDATRGQGFAPPPTCRTDRHLPRLVWLLWLWCGRRVAVHRPCLQAWQQALWRMHGCPLGRRWYRWLEAPHAQPGA